MCFQIMHRDMLVAQKYFHANLQISQYFQESLNAKWRNLHVQKQTAFPVITPRFRSDH
jgi:hypothetical protein